MTHISEHLKQLREHGYAIIEDVLTPEELAVVQKELYSTFPSLEGYQYAPSLYKTEPGGGHAKHLPHLGDVLNFVAVNPTIVSIAERALETKKITLVTSHVWAKYPGLDNHDMPLHTDYSSSTLLYPSRQGSLAKTISFILYYSDVDQEVGPTYVVSEQHSRDELLVPDVHPKNQYPKLYRYERPVNVRAGSMLAYSVTVFHRASALKSKNRIRYSHHITYQSDDTPWMGYNVWAKNSLLPEMRRFIEMASPRQRELFGFPPLDHAYWTEETIKGVAARYPLMEITPYIEAADLAEERKEQLYSQLQPPVSSDETRSATEDPEVFAATAYNYYRGAADYYAAVTGVASDYWLSWLLAQAGLNTQR